MLNNVQYAEFFIGVIFFILLLGYFRNFLLNGKYSTYDIVVTSTLFGIWFLSVKLISNSV